MPLTLDLPPDMESDLRREAARNGVEAESFVRDLIAWRLRHGSQQHIRLEAEEQDQLDAMNVELAPSFWHQYRELQERSREGRLSTAERDELQDLVQKTEEWNVRRLTLLEGFAQKRGIHFPELMRALGIQHHPDAGSA